MTSTFDRVPDAPVIALARQILLRARLSLACTTRAQALAVIRGVRPAPSRQTPLAIKPAGEAIASRCRKCGQPIRFGDMCRTFDFSATDEHITCPRRLESLYSSAIEQIGEVELCGRK